MAKNVSSLAVAVVVASALLLGGCGGGGDSGGSNTSTSDAKQNFIKKGDALCKATTDKVRGLAGQAVEDPAGAIIAALPAFEALSVDLKAIPPPPGDAEAAAIVAEFDKTLTQFRALAIARENLDVAAEQQVIIELQNGADAFAEKVKAYGFTECGLAGA